MRYFEFEFEFRENEENGKISIENFDLKKERKNSKGRR